MNSREILDLTNHLTQALDQNYDVVNMDAVLAVISTLEGTTITKEQLEATRLAKYVNQFRRRTSDDNLARRAKSLLKKWREMVGMQQTGGDAQQHPQTPAQPLAGTNAANSNSGVDNNTSSMISQSLPEARGDLEHVVSTRTDYAKAAANIARCTNAERFDRSNMSKSAEFALTDSKSSPPSAPTSFSNLISNLSNSNNINFSNKQNAQQNCLAPFIIDHSSNSNSTSNYSAVVGQRAPKKDITPIVIDSDSGEHAPPILQHSSKSAIQPMSSLPMPVLAHVKSNLKKSKKDKKRKEKIESKDEDLQATSGFATNAIGLTSKAADVLSSNTGTKMQTSGDCATMSNISEILSISNSSMSSIFPSETNTAAGLKQNRNQDSDLSFAGKFNTSTNKIADTLPVKKVNGREGIAYNSDASNMDRHCKTLQPPCAVYENENSTSNSRSNSAYEVIDVVSSHENNYNKVFDAEHSAPTLSVSTQAHTTEAYNWDDSRKQNFMQRTGATDAQDGDNLMCLSVPKKRGRKKGSKGVDSIIAQETSLSQQIFGSGGKKVKTTKELFNEIQNRQLGIVSEPQQTLTKDLSPRLLHQKISRPASSCSEPSLHSPQTMDACLTNVTMSTGATRSSPDNISNAVEDARYTDSDTITSEPSYDGAKNLRKTKSAISLDSSSSTQPVLGAKKEKTIAINDAHKKTVENTDDFSDGANSPSSIDKQLQEMFDQLPEPEPISEIEEKYKAQLVPCTCSLIEDLNNIPNPTEDEVDNKGAIKVLTDINTFGGPENEILISVPVATNPRDLSHIKEETVDTPAPVPPKPKKSIFDLDFDEEEDELLLQSLVADAIATSVNQSQPVAIDKSISSSAGMPSVVDMEHPEELHVADVQIKVEPEDEMKQLEETDAQMPPLQLYRIVEDADCAAKKRYELQTNQITNFHIDALHNCYIPNVNGNWDDTKLVATEKELLPVYTVTDGADVVAKYGALINERIPKDLSQLTFRKTYKANRKTLGINHPVHVPFLGVAKCLPSCRKQYRKRLRQAQQQKINEEPSVSNAAGIGIPADMTEPAGASTPTMEELDGKNLGASALHISEPDESNSSSILTAPPEAMVIGDGDEFIPNSMTITDDYLSHDLLNIADDGLAISTTIEHEDNNDKKGLDSLHNDDDENVKKETGATVEGQLGSRRNSGCSSNSSLSKTQNCINIKLRNQRLMQSQRQQELDANADTDRDGKENENENDNGYEEKQEGEINKLSKRKRKKRKKLKDVHTPPLDNEEKHRSEPSNERRRVKRIRIAINGDIATQRQVTFLGTSSSENSTDSDAGNEKSSDLDKKPADESVVDTDAGATLQASVAGDSNGDANADGDTDKDENNASDVNNFVADDDSSLQSAASSMASEKVDTTDKADIEHIDDDDYESMPMRTTTNSSSNHDPEQEYAVVQHPLMSSSGNSNHIVLTIKKTPSKANSPASTLAAVSPRMPTMSNDTKLSVEIPTPTYSDEQTCKTLIDTKLDAPEEHAPLPLAVDEPKDQITKIASRKKSLRRRRQQQSLRRGTLNDSDMTRILSKRGTANGTQSQGRRKVHQELFFADELYAWNCDGERQRILNCESCSSSCAEDSECDFYTLDATDAAFDNNDNRTTTNQSHLENIAATTVMNPDSSCIPAISDSNAIGDNSDGNGIVKSEPIDEEDRYEYGEYDEEDDDDDDDDEEGDDDHDEEEKETLPTTNNYLLTSFNVIYPNEAAQSVGDSNCAQSLLVDPERCVDDKLQQLNLLQNKHCDDYNNLYNNNNLNIIKYSLANSDNCNDSCSKKNADNVDSITPSPTPVPATITTTATAPALTSPTAATAPAVDSAAAGPAPINTNTAPLYKQPVAYSEFRTGIRTVDADVSDEQGNNNNAHVQQFKEWHQVLQLRSYNNELLTVLPYVLLE